MYFSINVNLSRAPYNSGVCSVEVSSFIDDRSCVFMRNRCYQLHLLGCFRVEGDLSLAVQLDLICYTLRIDCKQILPTQEMIMSTTGNIKKTVVRRKKAFTDTMPDLLS